jgi:hypothetical protein
MGQPLLNHKPARRGRPPSPWAATPRPVKRAPRRRRHDPAPGQLQLDLPTLHREHPADACQWCGQEPTTFTADGLGWCLAHTPADALP